MEMKEIKGFDGYYAVSDGNIYSSITNKNLSSFVDNVGYKQVVLYKDKKRHYKRVHRLIAETFIPNKNNLSQVNHINGDKLDNRVENLEWTNNSGNTKHAYDNNMYLSTKQISVKSKSKINGEERIHKSIRACAKELNINRKTLSSILHGNKSNNFNYHFEILNNSVV